MAGKIGQARTLLICIAGFAYVAAIAQEPEGCDEIVQSRGVDQRVDYASLAKYGPWDDRNYSLTAEDLEYLSADEHELRNGLPAFFRVELRKEMPHLRRSGPAQYPRAALNLFEHRHGGIFTECKVKEGEQKSKLTDDCDEVKETQQD